MRDVIIEQPLGYNIVIRMIFYYTFYRTLVYNLDIKAIACKSIFVLC